MQISTRDCNRLSATEIKDYLDNDIYVLAKKPMVKQRNEDRLRSTGNPVTKIPSINVSDILCSEGDDFAERIPTTLQISIGTKIMLTHKICINKGR